MSGSVAWWGLSGDALEAALRGSLAASSPLPGTSLVRVPGTAVRASGRRAAVPGTALAVYRVRLWTGWSSGRLGR
jgi:hypothetical protein